MNTFEYKVVAAPKKGIKAKGLKTGEARFANALEMVMNDMGRDGWEYQRTDTLPSEERSGLTGKTTVFQNMLVFRRTIQAQETPAVSAPEIAHGAAADIPAQNTPEAPAVTKPRIEAAVSAPLAAPAAITFETDNTAMVTGVSEQSAGKPDGEKPTVAAE